MQLIAAFFGGGKGYFVEVGANEPRERSQTWHLEQAGWTGVLIEPQPELAAQAARRTRTAKVFAVACSSPENAGGRCRCMSPGRCRRSIATAWRRARRRRPSSRCRCARSTASWRRPARRRDFDFLSIDVEGHEIEVLRGFDIARWQPRLILLEDHVADLSKHRYLKSAGYRIVRRYENNGWYVPRDAADRCRLADRWEILRKYYLALPFRWLRNFSRRLRAPDHTRTLTA